MDPFGPPRKKLRPEVEFVNGNGGIHTHTHALTDVGTRRFNPTDIVYGDPARFKQPTFVSPEMESLPTGLGSKSKACTKFFSTSGCPFGENCHFMHYSPGGVNLISQVSNLGSGLRTASRNSTGPPTSILPPDQAAAVQPYKTRMCNRHGTAEGCRFGDKCHFAHSENELKKGNTLAPVEREWTSSYGRPVPGVLDGRPGGRLVQHEATTPGMAAAASFGSSATAKISVDASLSGAIIGKGGVNSKQICRVTGVKLAIKDHESDSNLKNIELEGSFDQIKQASTMVHELIMQTRAVAAKPSGFVSNNFKTKLCENFSKGTCTFGDRCHFAHGASELR